MLHETETESVIFTSFLIGIAAAIYYLFSLLISEISFEEIIEKTILVGIIIATLIILGIVLSKELEMKKRIKVLEESGVKKLERKRTAKDVKKDMMRMYRDMGALKIVLQDNIINKETYNKERKELDKKVNILKKEYENLTKK